VNRQRIARHLLLLASTLLLLLAALAPATAAARVGLDPALRRVAGSHPRERVSVIIQFKSRVSHGRAMSLVHAYGGRDTSVISIIHAVAARMTASRARALAGRTAAVHAVSLNTQVRSQTVDFNPAQLATWFNQDASTQNLWNQYTGAGVGVAVIDTGVDGNLPDFQVSQSNTASRVIASAVVNPNATTAADTYGHGTMVAGLIAGDGGNYPSGSPLFGQFAGSAPGANIVSIKASDDQGNASVLDVLYGIQFAIDHKSAYNIRVINLSLQSDSAQSYTTDPLDAAVEAAWFDGIVVVAAAGNNGLGGGVDYAPGNDPYVITVGAVGDSQTIQHVVQQEQSADQQQVQQLQNEGLQPAAQQLQQQDQAELHALQQSAGDPAPWSSSGQTQDGFTKPDMYGPGRFIAAPLAPNSVFASQCPSCVVDGGYIVASGTSLATPIVSGAVADLLQAHPSWTPDMVKGALMASSTAPPGYPGGSAGMISANTASSVAPNNLVADQGLTPSSLVVMPSSAGGTPSWANWSRSSWSTAEGSLSAPWARSSWSCTCGAGSQGVAETRSSWSSLTWTVDFNDTQPVS
jgi:serine protease AprX